MRRGRRAAKLRLGQGANVNQAKLARAATTSKGIRPPTHVSHLSPCPGRELLQFHFKISQAINGCAMFSCLIFVACAQNNHVMDWLYHLAPANLTRVALNRMTREQLLAYLYVCTGLMPSDRLPSLLALKCHYMRALGATYKGNPELAPRKKVLDRYCFCPWVLYTKGH